MFTVIRSAAAAASTPKLTKRSLASLAQNLSNQSSDEAVKITKLPSGLVVASVPSNSALSRVAVIIRAGSRYESTNEPGLTHALRSAAGLATANYTSFGITRNIEYFGGRLSVGGTRDTISYLLETQQDDDALERNFTMLGETITKPAFKHWELADNVERIKADLSVLNDTPYIQLAEALHQAAFKGGLSNSLYMPSFMVGKHTPEQLQKFVSKHFVGINTVVVGTGIPFGELQELVGKNLSLSGSQAPAESSKFIGGELHLQSPSSHTYIALAAEGAGLKNSKEVATLSLLQTILGTGPQIKNTFGLSQVSRLGVALSSVLNAKSGAANDVAVSAFNVNYENTGLFGINLIAPNTADVKSLLKAAVKEFRATVSSVTDAELADAKKNLKTSALIATDNLESTTLEIGNQLLLGANSASYLSANDYAKLIDSISVADVKAITSKMLKGRGKLALATVGANAPYLDDLAE